MFSFSFICNNGTFDNANFEIHCAGYECSLRLNITVENRLLNLKIILRPMKLKEKVGSPFFTLQRPKG